MLSTGNNYIEYGKNYTATISFITFCNMLPNQIFEDLQCINSTVRGVPDHQDKKRKKDRHSGLRLMQLFLVAFTLGRKTLKHNMVIQSQLNRTEATL